MSNTLPFLQWRGWSSLRVEWQKSPRWQERRVVTHYVTTLPQRKGPEEQNAIGFAAAVGEPTDGGVGFSSNGKFDWRLFWARLMVWLGLEICWKQFWTDTGKIRMVHIMYSRGSPGSFCETPRFEIIYTLSLKPFRKISAIITKQLPFFDGFWCRLFHPETVLFSITQPSLQTSACEKAKCWRSALRLATLHSTKRVEHADCVL